MTKARLLRSLLSAGPVVAPGAFDGGTAMLVERAGFPAVYMTGAGVSSTFGLPDYGLLTMTEMVDRAGLIAGAVGIPAIVDADTGYGNELNVTRAVRAFEAAGVAGLHIEDQVSPKRCGHLTGKEIVSRGEFMAKLRAALAARRDPDLLIVARTDARAVIGLDEAVERANEALAAGADMAFVEAVATKEEAATVPQRVNGPCLLNIVMGGITPVDRISDAEDMGYRLVIAPGLVLGSMVGAARAALDLLKESGVHPPMPDGLTPAEVFRLFGSAEWDGLRQKFSSSSETQ